MLLSRCAIVAFGLLAVSLSHAASQRTAVSTAMASTIQTASSPRPAANSPRLARDLACRRDHRARLRRLRQRHDQPNPSRSSRRPASMPESASSAAQDGVTVAAGAGDKVTLRGLTINGQGGNRGIVVTSGAEVHIEQCVVTNLVADGIRIGRRRTDRSALESRSQQRGARPKRRRGRAGSSPDRLGIFPQHRAWRSGHRGQPRCPAYRRGPERQQWP